MIESAVGGLSLQRLQHHARSAGLPAALSLLLTFPLGACVTTSDAPAAKPPAPAIVSEHLIGLTPAALTETLGTPRARRRDRPAEVWQYRTESCVLDVFLYSAEAGPQVIHLEARDAAARPIPAQACLGTMTRGTHT